MNEKVWTVASLSKYIKSLIGNDPAFRGDQEIVIEGNVSGISTSQKGHMYFSLLDPGSTITDYSKPVLSCVMFKGYMYSGLTYDMKDGDNVRIIGQIDTYEHSSGYQLKAHIIEKAGIGRLAAQKRALDEEFRAKGYYENHKPMPKYITRIGIVTSAKGKVISDMIRNIRKRNPHVQILLAPSSIAGNSAPGEIAEGLRKLDRLGFDILVCGRGGGSEEELAVFDSREVNDAIFECETPVVSAVGHDEDCPLSDKVADIRVSTPTAVEQLVFDYSDYVAGLKQRYSNLDSYIRNTLMNKELSVRKVQEIIYKRSPNIRAEKAENRLAILTRDIRQSIAAKIADRSTSLLRYRPLFINAMKVKTSAAQHDLEMISGQLPVMMERKVSDRENRCRQISMMLPGIMERTVTDRENSLKMAAQKLEYSSPLKKIIDGFAYVEGPSGRVTSITQVQTDDAIQVRLRDGVIDSTVTGIKEEDIGNRK